MYWFIWEERGNQPNKVQKNSPKQTTLCPQGLNTTEASSSAQDIHSCWKEDVLCRHSSDKECELQRDSDNVLRNEFFDLEEWPWASDEEVEIGLFGFSFMLAKLENSEAKISLRWKKMLF